MKELKSKIAYLRFDEKESILYVETFNEIEMSLENLADHNHAVLEITGGKKHFAMVDIGLLYYIDMAGVKFAAASKAYEKRLAIAFYGGPLSNRLNVILLKMQEGLHLPINVFVTKEEALGWLNILKATKDLKNK